MAFLIIGNGISQAEGPSAWISVPSTVASGQRLEIKGGNLAAGTVVTIKIVAPDASEATFSTTSDASGNLTQEYVPNSAGLFTVSLYDIDGGRISFANFASSTP